MKKLIWMLLLIPGVVLSQKLPKHLQTGSFYIKLEQPGAISVCGETPANFFISNRRIYIDTYHQHFDLKVVKRKKYWTAKDKDGNSYYIFGTTVADDTALIIDPQDVKKPVFIISTVNLCGK